MKKTILILGIFFLALSQSFAMSSDKADTKADNPHNGSHCKHHKHTKSSYVHKLADIYSEDKANAEKIGSIKFKERENYSIFFCKENTWCQVVNQEDGSTGWINLKELQKMQEKYKQVMQKKANLAKLTKYVQMQDKKIIQLQTTMVQMQNKFFATLQNQQAQIDQLKQANYY